MGKGVLTALAGYRLTPERSSRPGETRDVWAQFGGIDHPYGHGSFTVVQTCRTRTSETTSPRVRQSRPLPARIDGKNATCNVRFVWSVDLGRAVQS